MSERFDLAVLGAGPAGASAAIEAAALGLRVVVLDESPAAGGQVYRAPCPGISLTKVDADVTAGNILRRNLAASAAECWFVRQVWLVEPGFRVSSYGPAGPETAEAEALIVATGALERHMPAPGWTLPGVMGLAAATILLKSQKILPGRRVVVAGSGPLLLLVAARILEGGGKVAAIIDASSRSDWLRLLPAMLSRLDLLGHGAGWLLRTLTRGVPLLSSHAVRRFDGRDGVERVLVGPVDADWKPIPDGVERAFACDAACIGFGLMPATDITRLLGATHIFEERLGGWVAAVDADQRTDVPHLYACGDAAGVAGAAAAPLQGRIAALAAARDLGRLSPSRFAAAAEPLQATLSRVARFGAAMTLAALPRQGVVEAITPDTIVCRCEGLTRADLDGAIADGAQTINALKSATRCGMGPCGGRVCEEAAAGLITAATARTREAIGQATGRPPLRPVPIAAIAGDFDYDSLPFPEQAPL